MHGWLSAVESGLLAGSDEKLGILHGRVLQNSMAEIEDVANAVEFGGDLERGLTDFFGGAEENSRIEIPLNSDARASKLPELAERNSPVDAQNVGTGL